MVDFKHQKAKGTTNQAEDVVCAACSWPFQKVKFYVLVADINWELVSEPKDGETKQNTKELVHKLNIYLGMFINK